MSTRVSTKELLTTSAIAAVVTIAANVVVTLVAKAALGVGDEFEPMHPSAPVIATLMYMVFGTIVLLLVARFAKKPALTYWIIASVGLALSFVPNINLARDSSEFPGATPGAMVVLALQHVIAFAIFVPWVTRKLPRTKA